MLCMDIIMQKKPSMCKITSHIKGFIVLPSAAHNNIVYKSLYILIKNLFKSYLENWTVHVHLGYANQSIHNVHSQPKPPSFVDEMIIQNL